MIQLDLNDREQSLLRWVLEYNLANLREEIGRTDDYNYRMGLKEREAVLNKILASLTSKPAETPG